jgi:UDP:flavonoid glycosyltransferase YjiC (YdhE family)
MCYAKRPLDLRQVARQCDLAILNAGHGTTANILLGGKPCLLFPQYTEQMLFSQKVQKLKAGITLSVMSEPKIMGALELLLTSPEYRAAAMNFAHKYANFAPGQQIPEIVERIDALCGPG